MIIMFGSVAYTYLLIILIDNGMDLRRQLLLLIPMVLITIICLIIKLNSPFEYLDYGLLTTPIITVGLYNLLNLVTWEMYDREFRLRIRNSRTATYKREELFKWTDTAFSFLLIFVTLLWSPILAVLIKNWID